MKPFGLKAKTNWSGLKDESGPHNIIAAPGPRARSFFRGAALARLAQRSPLSSGNLLEDLLQAVFPALIGHLLLASALQLYRGPKLFGGSLDGLWLPVLSGQFGKDGKLLQKLINALDYPVALHMAIYCIVACGLGYCLGVLLLYRASRLRLEDRLLPPLARQWYELLERSPGRERARLLEAGFSENEAKIRVCFSALVETKEGTQLFYGVLEAYYYDRQGALDRVQLSGAMRRELTQGRTGQNQVPQGGDGRYYTIVGNALVLRASEMKTFNVIYRTPVELATQTAADLTPDPA